MKKIFNTTVGLTLTAAIMFVGGCKKAAVDGHVSSRTEAYTANGQTQNETINYTYDGQGRQILMSPSSGNSTSTSYGTGTLTQVTGSSTIIYTVNAQGYVSSGNNFNYVYDSNGYLTNITSGANSETVTVSGGNSTNITITNNGVTTSNNFSFLTNKDYRDFGNVAFGKRSTNLPSTNLISTGGNTTTYNYSYTYDSKGRVLQETITGNNTTDIYTYTYTTN